MQDRKFHRMQLTTKERSLLSFAEQEYWRYKGEYIRVIEWSMLAFATYDEKHLNDKTIKESIVRAFKPYNKACIALYALIKNLNRIVSARTCKHE